MVDPVKSLGYKITLPKLFVAVFGLFLLLWIGSFAFPNELAFMHNIPFDTMVLAIWLGIAGIWDLVIGLASIPDAKKGRSKAGGYTIIGIGLLNFVLALTFFIGGTDLLRDSPQIATVTVIAFGFTVLFWFAHVTPEIVKRKSFLHLLN